jgi:hypothetical protein
LRGLTRRTSKSNMRRQFRAIPVRDKKSYHPGEQSLIRGYLGGCASAELMSAKVEDHSGIAALGYCVSLTEQYPRDSQIEKLNRITHVQGKIPQRG